MRLDSLLSRLPGAKQDTNLCRLYYDIAYVCYNRDMPLSFEYVDKCMALAKKLKWKRGMSLAYNGYGNLYNNVPNYDLALESYKKSQQLAIENNDFMQIGASYNNIALVYRNKNEEDKALENFKKSVIFNVRAPKQENFLRIMGVVKNLYKGKKQFAAAHEFFNSVLKMANNDLYRAYITIVNGDVYLDEKNKAEALKNYEVADKLIQSIKNINAHGLIIEKYGSYYLAQKDTAKAIEYIQRAAGYYAENNNIKQYDELQYIAGIYYQNNRAESIKFFLKAAEVAAKYGSDQEGYAYQSAAAAYDADKQPAQAVKYQEKAIATAQKNQNKVDLTNFYTVLANHYQAQQNPALALKNFLISADMNKQNGVLGGQAYNMSDIALTYVKLKEYTKALESLKQERDIAIKVKDENIITDINAYTAQIYSLTHNYPQALKYALEAEKFWEGKSNNGSIGYYQIALSDIYYQMHNYAKTLEYAQKTLQYGAENDYPYFDLQALQNIARAHYKQQNYSKAMIAAQRSITANQQNGTLAKTYNVMGLIIRDAPDSILTNRGIQPAQRYTKALEYLNRAYNIAKKEPDFPLDDQTEYWRELSTTYEKQKDYNKAYDAYKTYVVFKDSADVQSDQVNFRQNETQFNYGRQADSIRYQQQLTSEQLKRQTLLATQQRQTLLINQQQLALANRQKDLQQLNYLKTQADLKANQSRLKASQKEQALAQTTLELQKTELNSKRTQSRFFIGGIVILLLLSFFVGLNYYNQRKANRIIVSANKQTAIQKAAAESRLTDLKAAQNQLVQSEKMASLGELTAGIAHEIQNPLNFVNNFAEVSMELIEEMNEELAKGNMDDAKAIAVDIKQNLEKIRHHGKRADFIVKGMLQHSRTSTGERQATNINLLADEFFKLSYHGLRAKDKSFNAELATHFDTNPPKVDVVQQDVGRVLLNLFNNAFYAVNQKQKTVGAGFKPLVEVTTSSTKEFVIVTVKDNGVGIPADIKEKILQPFFTTKPTGEGTGLGLSLSYDIIVKGHNGKIEIDSVEGEGSEFKILLPVT